MAQNKESWGSRIGVILAVMGSAVGLGNFLRFPGLAAQHDGGAFMVPYFIALLLLGIPLAWGEWAMGRYGGTRGYNSSPGIFRVICKRDKAAYLGVLGMLVPVAIFMYYILIESWCLAYAVQFADGTMSKLGRESRAAAAASNVVYQAQAAAMPEQAAKTPPLEVDKTPYKAHFTRMTGAEADGSAVQSQSALFFAICFIVNFLLIYLGLTKGIEKFCLWAMPALVICALLVLARVLTLPRIDEGLAFMWNPHTEKATFLESLMNPKMWLDATGQIFFSLSVGFGVIINYASYLKKDDDIALSSLTSAAGNEFCEVALGGMITIPAAFLFLGATTVTAAAGSSFDLGFNTLPMVFELMPMGHLAGFLFFSLLFLAAITSSLSMLQPAIALLEEGLGLARKASVAILGFVTLCGAGFVLYFSAGVKALDTFDTWAGTLCIMVLALLQVILFGWVLGAKKGYEELKAGAEIRVPRVVVWNLKYIAPVYLMIILGAFLYQQVTATDKDGNPTGMFAAVANDHVVGMSVGFLALTAIFFALIIAQSIKRWKQRDAQAQEEQP